MTTQKFQEHLSIPSRILNELTKPFVGREEEAKVILLALLTKEHVVLIGEPGTAKSALIRRVAQILNMKCFTYLLTKYTEPAELFGPLDINALKDGKYVRITSNKLPEAEIVFLDEVFKANSAILNTLLTIMNERLFYDGYTEMRVPLWSLFGASNEVPEDPELEAMYDRFLLRHYVKPLPEDMWKDLLRYSWNIERYGYPKPEVTVSKETLEKIHEAVMMVDFTNIEGKLLKLFSVLESKNIHLTDRRKGKALKVIAAHSVLNGRLVASEEDLIVLKFVAPHDIEDFERVNIILSEELKTAYRYLRELEEILISVKEVGNYISTFPTINSRFVEYRLLEIYRDLESTRDRVISMTRETNDEKVHRKAMEVIENINDVIEKIKQKIEGR
ncbi:ATPase associated with various cellular activities AAA_5 [Ignisphaera aggregans DSM 17230]|uniref:ATPase associated with various cellular activities AAA_5 n=1 Tax=Ignisphaera aggregans (strain DSM 17230 / JCM 13409 / AQ1.S1) TaxID=583356 RepID=E0SQJ0_IGNAA|nr:ATPase associated with various cellular activities AAA_5 [Ignisphaera aggregans DSM 17230]